MKAKRNIKIMKKFLVPALGLLLAVGLFSIEPAAAQLIDPGDSPANIAGATGGQGSFRAMLREIINFFLYFLGLVATIMVIYGGFLYITSGGDDAGAETGKKILMYAGLCIIVILVAFAMVNTIIGVACGFGSRHIF